MNKSWLAAALASTLALLLVDFLHVGGAPADPFDTVVIDAGHGGEDSGARGPAGLAEKRLVLDVARRVTRRLTSAGLRVVMTRDGDVAVPLDRRRDLANQARADLFVSIHANAAPDPAARGVETYFLSLDASDEAARRVAELENQAFRSLAAPAAAAGDPLLDLMSDLLITAYLEESNAFAKLAHAELARLDRGPGRGVKQAPFVVLMGLQMPASLVEIGFLSHPEEERALASGNRRQRIADALARAVLRYAPRHGARSRAY